MCLVRPSTPQWGGSRWSKEEEELLGTPHDYDIDGHPDDTLSRA